MGAKNLKNVRNAESRKSVKSSVYVKDFHSRD